MPEILQNILIILLSAYMAWDGGSGGQLTNNWPVTIGFVMGIIMGDINTAMIIAGTLQLMSLGVAGIGGASVPEYGLATIVSIFIAVRTGASTGTAIAVGLPVGMLTLQLDLIVKFINNFFAHLSQRFLHEKKFKKMQWSFIASIGIWTLKYVIPVSIVIMFGPTVVKDILAIVPKWFTDGLSIAGGMLPVVGVGMLLRYMPTKKYLTFLIAGFVLAAYLKMPILGVALLGAAAAYMIYQNQVRNFNKENAVQAVGSHDTQGDDYDE
ncbi:PTS mannose/fructose/sorbose/N-acetylgalactosamine transporter subunit IIC [Lacticaseibacillus zeae]|uniref:PTS sugar transporter subunit IIC n=1 Tax=Lacticaseibacillus zeae subsp. silagei TaxID=3068307 RepID=A0ABD7ZAQ8_LACZE|nr:MULTISPECIES: PTS sugar transporter subunit IIC [Lacticaseibacillus]MDE3314436.1 PTS sugar transporter subunit IIC [Lacticaseibacillus zeae]OFR98968.1 PTS N-acetylgalactosamine transporter subunit IIA [Lactobacillus sp. HMSC068F07]WLV84064.1 PTS sugar transporter subunit IIC [Lacticaseibacillus sp. NCIMB 15475]WLV86819.1 PTS sugar transporter subunit IIC [Lacticaseibacillus sp. NCIMB 15474]